MNLNTYYSNLQSQVLEELRNNFDTVDSSEAEIPIPLRDRRTHQFLTVSQPQNDEAQRLVLALPSAYPDALPKIYIPASDLPLAERQLHIDMNGLVCTVEEKNAIINADKAAQALIELTTTAFDIAFRSKSGSDHQQMLDEISAYWNDDARMLRVASLLSHEACGRIAHLVIPPTGVKFGWAGVIGRDVWASLRWLRDAGLLWKRPEEESADGRPCVFQVLVLQFDAPPARMPESVEDSISILEQLDTNQGESARAFLSREVPFGILIGIFPIQERRVFLGWRHSLPADGPPVGRACLLDDRTVVRRIQISRLDDHRLQSRTGGSVPDLMSSSVSIVGCGSVGSHLALSLASAGVRHLRLVDSELLAEENIQRHLCGFPDLGTPKAMAVSQMIKRRFPAVETTPMHTEALQGIRAGKLDPSSGDLIVSATANMAVERRLGWLARQADTQSYRFISLWMEPYGVGGHLLYIHPSEGACYDCLFDGGQFRYAILEGPLSEHYQRETGCQSSFIAYSGVDAQIFSGLMAREIVSLLRHPSEHTLLISWYAGDRAASAHGAKLSNDWLSARDMSSRRHAISAFRDCPNCSS